MKQKTSTDSAKNLMAFACIAMSLIGLILGIIFPKPLADTFSLGGVLSLIAFLLSLASVKDRGSNLPAILAFSISFITLAISIAFSGLSS